MHRTMPFSRLPAEADFALSLIAEELKTQKFFDGLYALGVEDCFWEPRLGRLILHQLSLDDGRDETFEFYQKVIERHLPKLEADYEMLSEHALSVYRELMAERDRRA